MSAAISLLGLEEEVHADVLRDFEEVSVLEKRGTGLTATNSLSDTRARGERLGAVLDHARATDNSVYVAEEAVGRGIGMALLSALLELLRELGYIKVYAVIAPPNPASVALHEKLGFASLCRFSDTAYKLGSWQAVDWMELTLRDIPPVPAEPIAFTDFARARPERLAEILGW